MFLLGTIDSDSDGEMLSVLLDKPLYFLCSVIDAICGEREAIGVEPMMFSAEHLYLEVVAYLVDKVYLQKGFAAYKVPYHALLLHLVLMVKHIVNGLLSNLPGHSLFRVLSHEVAVFTSQLTILGDDEGDILGDA